MKNSAALLFSCPAGQNREKRVGFCEMVPGAVKSYAQIRLQALAE